MCDCQWQFLLKQLNLQEESCHKNPLAVNFSFRLPGSFSPFQRLRFMVRNLEGNLASWFNIPRNARIPDFPAERDAAS